MCFLASLTNYACPRRWVDRCQVFLNSNEQGQWGKGGDGSGEDASLGQMFPCTWRKVTLRPLDPSYWSMGELSKVTFDIEKEVHHVCFVTNTSENNTGNFFSGTTDELFLAPAVCLGGKGC